MLNGTAAMYGWIVAVWPSGFLANIDLLLKQLCVVSPRPVTAVPTAVVGHDDGQMWAEMMVTSAHVSHPADLYLQGPRLRHHNSICHIRSLITCHLSPAHLGFSSGLDPLVSSLYRLCFGDRRLKRDELGDPCFCWDCHGWSRGWNQSVYLPGEICINNSRVHKNTL